MLQLNILYYCLKFCLVFFFPYTVDSCCKTFIDSPPCHVFESWKLPDSWPVAVAVFWVGGGVAGGGVGGTVFTSLYVQRPFPLAVVCT